jgi:predicted AAA+ superfamily ATPase
VLAAPEEAAHGLRRALVEILRQLNRDEMEEPEVPGLEVDELREILARRAFPLITRGETRQAVEVLVRNGFASELTEPRYAWTRGRVVRDRFTITTPGKAFLLEATERVGRI